METAIQVRAQNELTASQASAVEARNGTRIQAATREEVAQMFRRLLVLIGAAGQNVPHQVEFDLLLESAPIVLGKWTTMEVLTAFTLAIRGEIEAELRLFDKPFSLLYISNVMKAYEGFRAEALYKHGKTLDVLPEHQPSQAERDEQMRREALECYRLHCEGSQNWSIYHPPLFDYLQRMGVILFSPERIEQVKREALVQVRTDAVNAPTFTMQVNEALKTMTTDSSQVERKAKEMLLREFFAELQHGGNELETLIR